MRDWVTIVSIIAIVASLAMVIYTLSLVLDLF